MTTSLLLMMVCNGRLQEIPMPFQSRGEHSGVAVFDLNGDGYQDVLFSAGRHGIGQSYAFINLGRRRRRQSNVQHDDSINQTSSSIPPFYNFDDNHDESFLFKFSNPIPIGPPGQYYQVDASNLSWLPSGHVAVLLAGGNNGRPGSTTPAILMDVSITECAAAAAAATNYNTADGRAHTDDASTTLKMENADDTELLSPCRALWRVIWTDPEPVGDRNGALAPTLGNVETGDPAIVLAGNGCVTIFEPAISEYKNHSSFRLSPNDKVANDQDNIKRSAGLAVGYVGRYPGLVAGVRTTEAPSPLVAIYKTAVDGGYKRFDFGNSGIVDAYGGNAGLPIDPTGVALGDLNGDGLVDVVESNFLSSRFIGGVDNNKNNGTMPSIAQFYYLMMMNRKNDKNSPVAGDTDTALTYSKTTADKDGILTTTPTRLFESFDTAGRSIDVGQIYDDSNLPDIVYGMASGGELRLFANLGVDEHTGRFLGFKERQRIHVGSSSACTIRDVLIAQLWPETVSILCATRCCNSRLFGGYVNYMFTAALSKRVGGEQQRVPPPPAVLDLAKTGSSKRKSVSRKSSKRRRSHMKSMMSRKKGSDRGSRKSKGSKGTKSRMNGMSMKTMSRSNNSRKRGKAKGGRSSTPGMTKGGGAKGSSMHSRRRMKSDKRGKMM